MKLPPLAILKLLTLGNIAMNLDPCGSKDDALRLRILLVLEQARGSFGVLESKMAEASNLPTDEMYRILRTLEEEGVVRTRITQEGTAGPYGRRIFLQKKLVVTCQFTD